MSTQVQTAILIPGAGHGKLSWPKAADRTLRAAAGFWFVVVVLGELIFATTVASFYGLTAVRGNWGIAAVTMGAFWRNIKRAYDGRKSIAETLSATIATSGVDLAAQQYHQLRASAGATYNLDEDELNVLGYQLIQAKNISQAVRVFQLNLEAYPNSANAYDSLAEAYMDDGDKPQAIANYQRSLQLNPKNNNAVMMLQKLHGP